MNWIDISVIGLVLTGGVLGFIRGLLHQAGRLLTLPLACYSAIYYHGSAVSLLELKFSPTTAGILAYLLVFLVFLVGLNVVVHLVDVALTTTALKFYDRLFGFCLGSAAGVIVAGALLFGLAMFPAENVKRSIKKSQTGVPLLQATKVSIGLIPQSIKDRVDRTLKELKVEAGEKIEDMIEEEAEERLPAGEENDN